MRSYFFREREALTLTDVSDQLDSLRCNSRVEFFIALLEVPSAIKDLHALFGGRRKNIDHAIAQLHDLKSINSESRQFYSLWRNEDGVIAKLKSTLFIERFKTCEKLLNQNPKHPQHSQIEILRDETVYRFECIDQILDYYVEKLITSKQSTKTQVDLFVQAMHDLTRNEKLTDNKSSLFEIIYLVYQLAADLVRQKDIIAMFLVLGEFKLKHLQVNKTFSSLQSLQRESRRLQNSGVKFLFFGSKHPEGILELQQITIPQKIKNPEDQKQLRTAFNAWLQVLGTKQVKTWCRKPDVHQFYHSAYNHLSSLVDDTEKEFMRKLSF